MNIIEFLLSLGAFLSSEHKKEALILAIRQGRLSVVQALLENHEHLKPFAMSAAVSSRQIDVIEALMSAGVALSSNQRVLVVDIAAESTRITTILALLENHEYLRHSARNALIRYGHLLLLHSLRDPRQLVFDKTFTLSFDDVRSDPKQYLDMVINKGFPREILLLDSLGAPIKTIDAGGVRKGFVTFLFESLTPLLHLSSSLLLILEENEENQVDIENAKELFRKIGCFFSELQQANRISSDPFLIGSIFNKKFFEVLSLILNAKNDNTLHQQLAGLLKEVDPALSTLSNVIIDPQNDDFKTNFALAYGLSDLSDVNSTAEKILESYLLPASQLLFGCSKELKKIDKN